MPKTTIEIWWNEPDDKRYLSRGNVFDAIRGKLPNTFVTINGTPVLEQPQQTDVDIDDTTVHIWWRTTGHSNVGLTPNIIATALHHYFGGLPTFHVEEVHAPQIDEQEEQEYQLDLGL